MLSNPVVAVAQMQASVNDQRQHYLAIENILRLEEVYNQGKILWNSSANEIIDLIAIYRHFQATDPRENIYVLIGIFFGEGCRPYSGIRIDYSIDNRDLYVNFAMMALRNGPGWKVSAIVAFWRWKCCFFGFRRVEKPLQYREILRDGTKP